MSHEKPKSLYRSWPTAAVNAISEDIQKFYGGNMMRVWDQVWT